MAGKRQITTMCPMNCLPTQCGMTVEVEDNRLLTLKGDPHNPDSRGFLCIRGRATSEIFNNPRRLLRPLRRIGARGENRWQECSWDEAYDMMVGAIEQTQPERVGLWRGHGVGTTGILSPLISRFAFAGGYQQWSSAIVCWAMGGYGLGLTGLLETSTKEDMAANSRTILFWGSTLASQPGTAPHLIEARKRGAYVIHIDTRRTEISRHADEVILLQPGSDAALALAMAQVILQEGLSDRAFIEAHTVGFEEFAAHVQQYTPEWAAAITGVEAERIRLLARRYARETPSMIVLGGSSMYKHQHGWEASRAIACLPALIGQLGIVGGGMGPRHGATARGDGYADILADVKKPLKAPIPSHMTTITEALKSGQIDVLLLLGSNLLSSFANANEVAQGLEQIKLIVSYDLFMNETSRRYADLVLPGTAWLEDIGLKQTATHIYLMERALKPEGESRTLSLVLRHLAERLGLMNFFPWQDDEHYIDALLASQRTTAGKALTVDVLREQGGYWQKSGLSHIAYPDRIFHTPSKKVEFWSERARQAGLSPLPSYTAPAPEEYPLRFCQGRTLTAFHAFFDEGRALPTLARANKTGPEVWIHPQDAQSRAIQNGSPVVIANARGRFEARACITEDVLQGVVWMRDGWAGVNRVTSGAPVVPLAANDIVPGIPGGQATYDAWVEVY
jgi:anaerobic selenocysteine-containing dehydrogenase